MFESVLEGWRRWSLTSAALDALVQKEVKEHTLPSPQASSESAARSDCGPLFPSAGLLCKYPRHALRGESPTLLVESQQVDSQPYEQPDRNDTFNGHISRV